MMEKGKNKSFEMQRPGPRDLNANDLVTVRDGTNGPKQRILCFFERPDGDYTAWIGPIALTPQDADEFAGLLQAGLPKPEKFKDCRPVDAETLRKVLDS